MLAHRFRDSFALAGWLFADLMVALALLFFASNPMRVDLPVPVVSDFEPGTGAPGSRVRIFGDHLDGVGLVRFGDAAATPLATESDSRVEAMVPPGAVTGRITVYAGDRFGISPRDFVVPTPTPTATLMPTPTATLTPIPTPVPAPTATRTPTAAPTATPCALTVSQEKLKEIVPSGSGPFGDPSPEVLRQRFASYEGVQAGLVITFGHGGQFSGTDRARRVNEVLRQVQPSVFTERTVMEPLFSTTAGTGVELWVYPLVSVCD